MKWYGLSAQSGNAEAECSLGSAYEHGTGVPQNLDTARHYYRSAADRGDATAQLALAVLLLEEGAGTGAGTGAEPARVGEAVRLLRLSVAGGSHDAEYRLGLLMVDPAAQSIGE